MKGILEKTTRGWVVKVLAAEGSDVRFVRTYPLHETDASHFDEAVRLGTHGEVEFELVKEWIDKHTNQVQVYAKLVLPMLDRLRAHLNSITPEQFNKEIEDIQSEFICKDENCKHCAEDIAQMQYQADLEKEAAIDFLKWVGGSYSFGNIAGKWYLHENTNKEYTEEELYELYLEQIK